MQSALLEKIDGQDTNETETGFQEHAEAAGQEILSAAARLRTPGRRPDDGQSSKEHVLIYGHA
jgi:hypothetical protein